jgi:tetratricopeptide (TPR) repeat protein
VVLSQTSEIASIFFSLAPQDKKLFEKLRAHLSILKKQGIIDIQYDSMIVPGSDTVDTIKSFIKRADIIVLLISAHFFDSDRCFGIEMPYALEQHNNRAAHIIPVLLRPTPLIGFPLAADALLPTNGKAVSNWSNQDAALKQVVEGIYQVIKKSVRRLVGVPAPVKPLQFPLFTLTDRRSPFFTDRKETLATLHNDFTSEQSIETRTQALYGLDGMGKTLLAIEYACRYSQEYQAVLWLNASSRQLLSASLLTLTHQLGIPTQDRVDEQERIDAIQHWLQHHDRWLLVLDNLNDLSILNNFSTPDHNHFPPLYSKGHVLITTQTRPTRSVARTLPIPSMDLEDSALFVLRRAEKIPAQGTRNDASEEDYLQALAIAREVEGYPLALDQAGAYIEDTPQALDTYLELYREQRAMLSKAPGQLATNQSDLVATTLALTFEKVGQSNPHAVELLHLFAFLYPEAIPNDMLQNGASSLSAPLRTLVTNASAFNSAIATLLKFSLVQQRADATMLNIHRTIQAVLKKRLSRKQQLPLANQAIRLINATFPEVSYANWKISERYLPQAQHCATLIHDFGLTLKECPLLLERLGSYYSHHGSYAVAETYLTQALTLQGRQRRANPLDTAQILNSLGLLSKQQARFQDALEYHQHALELRQRIPGPEEQSKVAESLHNLALVYDELGEYEKAEQFQIRALAQEEQTRGPDHPDVASTLNALATIYVHQGDYPQAQMMYQRALAIYERGQVAGHPDQMYPLDGLGQIAEAQDDYSEAWKYYQQAFAICKQALGEMHPETAHCINKLADIAESWGNYQEAETLYQQALSIGEQALGPEHPDVALFVHNLAFLVHGQGQYQHARELYQRALDSYEQALGSTHPNVAAVLNNQGKLYRNLNDEERAEKLLQQALAIYEKRLKPTHPDIAQAASDLADLLISQHKYVEAEPLLKRAHTILHQVWGHEHPDTTLVREQYTLLLERVGRYEEAALLRQPEGQ